MRASTQGRARLLPGGSRGGVGCADVDSAGGIQVAVIACVGLDGFVVGLVQRLRPADRVVAVGDDVDAILAERPGAVLVAGQLSAAQGLATTRLARRTVVVLPPTGGAPPVGHRGPTLGRPISVGQLRQVLDAVVPPRRGDWLRLTARRLSDRSSPERSFAAVRLVTGLIGFVLALSGPVDGAVGAGVVLATVLVVMRMWTRGLSIALVVLDVVALTVVVGLTSGTSSEFLLLAATISAEVGFVLSRPWVLAIVGTVTSVGLLDLARQVADGRGSGSSLVTWGLLFPLASLTGALASRIELGQQSTSRRLLSEMHGTLAVLLRQAQAAGGALEPSTVAEQVLESARQDVGATAGTLLLGAPPLLQVVGAFGEIGQVHPRVLLEGTDEADVLVAIADWFPAEDAECLRLSTDGAITGWLVVRLSEDAGRSARERVRELAVEAGLALDNARLFGRIREVSVDRERQRLARDLHDGVIQTLVHVGFELDLLSGEGDRESSERIRSVRDVVARTAEEVRGTVNDLRSARLEEGLTSALASLAREYQRPNGPTVHLHADIATALSPEAELQLLRIAQEAVSNAFQHASARRIDIALVEDDDVVRLTVQDDGIGFGTAPGASDPGRGVGLRAIRERVRLLDASVAFDQGPSGGARVRVEAPTGSLSQ